MDSALGTVDEPTDEARDMPPHIELDTVDKPEEETHAARDVPPHNESGTLDKPEEEPRAAWDIPPHSEPGTVDKLEEEPCAAMDPPPDFVSVPVVDPHTRTAPVKDDKPAEAHSWRSLFKHVMFHLALPRDLMIRSPRLGICEIILTVLMVLVLVVYVVYAEIWTDKAQPHLHSESVWLQAPADAVRAADTNVRHCTSPDTYSYTYVSGPATREYEPEGCENIGSEGFVQRGSSVILATYIADVTRAGTSGQECLVEHRECEGGGGEFVRLNTTTCECRRTRQLFAWNAEESTVVVTHGLKAENLPPWRKVLVTRFLRHDGAPCQVGGIEEVRSEASGLIGTFSGSIREWLSCAGVTLDSHPVDLGVQDDGTTTFLRTMGMNLVFQLHYTNVNTETVNEVICFVTPIAQPRWTTLYSYQVKYRGFSETQYHKVDRTIHGVKIKLKATGDLRYFDLQALIQGVVNVLFLLMLPKQVLVLISTLCLGSLSLVYNHARSTDFDIHEQLRAAIAKSILPLTAFRGLLGGDFEGSVLDMDPVYRIDVKKHMQDSFTSQLSCGQFEDRHINRMVMMLCEERGGEDPGTFDHNTFERICMKNELIGSESVVAMFHYRRKKRALEKLMDDSGGTPDDERLDVIFGDKRPKTKKNSDKAVDEEHKDLHRLWEQSLQQRRDEQDDFCENVGEMRQKVELAENAIREADAAVQLAAARAAVAAERGEMTELLAQQRLQELRAGEANREHVRDRWSQLEHELDSCVTDGRSAKHDMTVEMQRLEALRETMETLQREPSQPQAKEERKDAKKKR